MTQPSFHVATPPPTPGQLLHTQVRERIMADMATGNLKPGDRYYTEDELCQRFNVSRNTVRRAMADLEDRGYLKRKRGMGSVILQLPGQEKRTANAPDQTCSAAPGSQAAPATQQRRLIVILPTWNDSTEGFFTARLLRELTQAADANDWPIEIRHQQDPMALQPSPALACLAIDPKHDTIHRLHDLSRQGARVIALTPSHPLPFGVMIWDDTRQATIQAIHRFHELGHRRIGIVLHELIHRDYHEALTGYLIAHRELNLPIGPQAIVQSYFKNRDPLSDGPPGQDITAWITTYRSGTTLIAHHCRQRGQSIPQDVSIVGFDDMEDTLIPHTDRQLTVVRSDPAAAAQAVWSCLHRWHDDLQGQTFSLPMQWIDRQSVAPCKKKPTLKERGR